MVLLSDLVGPVCVLRLTNGRELSHWLPVELAAWLGCGYLAAVVDFAAAGSAVAQCAGGWAGG
jgi:hypothetical protein